MLTGFSTSQKAGLTPNKVSENDEFLRRYEILWGLEFKLKTP